MAQRAGGRCKPRPYAGEEWTLELPGEPPYFVGRSSLGRECRRYPGKPFAVELSRPTGGCSCEAGCFPIASPVGFFVFLHRFVQEA